jgi:tetratricopeptide (TPR) repeat protein
MNRPQWITAGIAIFTVFVLYAATSDRILGDTKPRTKKIEAGTSPALTIDSLLYHARETLPANQVARLNFLEHSISRGDVKDQKIHLYHQLSAYWRDSIRMFAPYAWYTAEAARLENSEKSLTFAAQLFLNNLVQEDNAPVKEWMAFQAKDLFERSLTLNPANDSSKVGLGSVYVYGGIATPMEGIGMIREVADRDTNNVYAQWTLGQASYYSRQLEKAVERFKRVIRLQPNNPEAILLIADSQEQLGNKKEAIVWYEKLLPLVRDAELRKEVETRIASLKK